MCMIYDFLKQKTKERKRQLEKNNYIPSPNEDGDGQTAEQKVNTQFIFWLFLFKIFVRLFYLICKI